MRVIIFKMLNCRDWEVLKKVEGRFLWELLLGFPGIGLRMSVD